MDIVISVFRLLHYQTKYPTIHWIGEWVWTQCLQGNVDTAFILWKYLSPVPLYYSPFPRQNTKCDFPAFINEVKVKVKSPLVQALRLCTGRKAYRENRGIAPSFHDHCTRWGWGVSVILRPFFTPGKDPVPIVQEAGWTPGPVWTGAENLAPPGFDPRTVQPVARRYTDGATRHTYQRSTWTEIFKALCNIGCDVRP